MTEADFKASPRQATVKELCSVHENELNVPSIHTPQIHSSIRKSIPSKPEVPAMAPPIPHRSPVLGRCPRSVSEDDATVTSPSHRRPIFVQYWSSTQNRSDLSGVNNGSLRRTKVGPCERSKFSSSISILDAVAAEEETADYRMYAPTKEHSDQSVSNKML